MADFGDVSDEVLRNEIESLLGTVAAQSQLLAETQAKATQLKVTITSEDDLVKVVTDHTGIPVDLRIDPAAFRSTTPAQLADSILYVVRVAADVVAQEKAKMFAPLTEQADALPDLPDLLPGAPSLHGLFDALTADPADERGPR